MKDGPQVKGKNIILKINLKTKYKFLYFKILIKFKLV